MFNWILTFLLFPLCVSGQYFHQIPDCYDDITSVQYYIDQQSDLEYSFEIIGGEILTTDNDGVLIDWESGGQLIVISTNDLGCASISTLAMELIPCNETTFYVPNAFTPNDDLINDHFTPKGTNYKYYEMSIYNRWGEQIFFTRNIMTGWDGTFKGRLCPGDVYVYLIVYQDYKNYYQPISGKLILVR